MDKPTIQEKLTAIVEAMEWKNCIEYDSEQEKYLISFFYGLDSDKEFSLPDLIANADAMRSIWGDGDVCIECEHELEKGFYVNDYVADKNICIRLTKIAKQPCRNSKWLPSYKYHGQQALNLNYDDYLYGVLPEKNKLKGEKDANNR
jgi:hypothetical protein